MTPRTERMLALLTGTVVFAVYVATGARHVLGGDNGEFASIFAHGGVAHPSGYPLYSLILRAFQWIPHGSAAGGAAFVTSLIGLGAFVAMRAGAITWGASRVAATLAAALVALSPLAWSAATHAEVFALHALVAAAILAVVGPHCGRPPLVRALIIGLLAGFGLSNNLSIVTLAPLGLYGAWVAVRDAAHRGRALATGFAGLGIGLTPYLWLYAVARRGEAPLVWGEFDSIADLFRHATRSDYGTLQLAISDAAPDRLGHVTRMVGHLFADLHYLPMAVAIVGVLALFRRNEAPPEVASPGRPRAPSISTEVVPVPLHRRAVRATIEAPSIAPPPRRDAFEIPPAAAIAWVAAWLLAGPVFTAQFNLPLEGLALAVVERFYLLPLVLCVVPLARGLDRVTSGRLATPDFAGPLVVGVMCLAIFLSFERVREHHRPDVEYYLLNTLATASRDAVILGTGDHRLYGFWYAQHALGRRTDVVYADPMMLMYPWYHARLEEQLGHALAGVDEHRVDSRALAAGLLASGRAVYLTNRFSDAITTSFPTYPVGTLIRVMPPGTPLPSPDELEALNVSVAVKYRYAQTAPRDPDGWAADVQRDHTRPWQVIADAYEAMGRPDDARRARSRYVIVPPRMP